MNITNYTNSQKTRIKPYIQLLEEMQVFDSFLNIFQNKINASYVQEIKAFITTKRVI